MDQNILGQLLWPRSKKEYISCLSLSITVVTVLLHSLCNDMLVFSSFTKDFTSKAFSASIEMINDFSLSPVMIYFLILNRFVTLK